MEAVREHHFEVALKILRVTKMPYIQDKVSCGYPEPYMCYDEPCNSTDKMLFKWPFQKDKMGLLKLYLSTVQFTVISLI